MEAEDIKINVEKENFHNWCEKDQLKLMLSQSKTHKRK